MRPSLSIIETTGPFFAVALVVAVLLRSGSVPEHRLIPKTPPAGRFGATVLQDGSVTRLEGDVGFSPSASVATKPPSSSAEGTDPPIPAATASAGPAVVGTADARFATAPRAPAVQIERISPGSASSGDSDPEPTRRSSTQAPSQSGPRFEIQLDAALPPGERFATQNVPDDRANARVRYFPGGMCSAPYEWTRGSLSAVRRSSERLQGRVRGVFRRIDVYRPDKSRGCGSDPIVPDDPTETIRIDLRYDALGDPG